MNVLNKTIKKLTTEEYQQLIQLISGGRQNKPFKVLEAARHTNKTDNEMMRELEVSPSAYYTLKSRLNDKIASLFAQNTKSPVNILMDEVTRVPAHLYGTNREFSIRALTDLQKQLIEYDLSAELIVVYKTLAQLSLYTENYNHYFRLYEKHVAYSLAVGKAEDIFYRFLQKLGMYLISNSDKEYDDLILMKRELFNICELYNSHRLTVFQSIANIYWQCGLPEKKDGLKKKEIEIEQQIQHLEAIFEKYNQDTLYQNINFIIPFLYFEFYQKAGNQVKADFYYAQAKKNIPEICSKHFHNFIVIQFLNSKIDKFLTDHSETTLSELNDLLVSQMDISVSECYHLISFNRFLAIGKFYNHDYNGAAKTLNQLRNTLSMKKFKIADVECRLFQALQYCILNEDGLCQQIISSLRRQLMEEEDQWKSALTFMKLLKTALKAIDLRKKNKRIHSLWEQFQSENTGKNAILKFVRLDESMIRRMSNPIKN